MWDRKSLLTRQSKSLKLHNRRELYWFKRGLLMFSLDLRHLNPKECVESDYPIHQIIFDQVLCRRSKFACWEMSNFVLYSLSKRRRWELEKQIETHGLPTLLSKLNFDVVVCKSVNLRIDLSHRYVDLFYQFFLHPFHQQFDFNRLIHWTSDNNERKIFENQHGRGSLSETVKLLVVSKQKSRVKTFDEPNRLTYFIHDPTTSLHFWNSAIHKRFKHKRHECCQPKLRTRFTDDDLQFDFKALDFDGLDDRNQEGEYQSTRIITLSDYLPLTSFTRTRCSTNEEHSTISTDTSCKRLF
ncbi:hypothetical protein M3Y96_00545200 [Aphelenchoides besseyi]|nr:hypothetical protein M3Y96_00545200 [Aphelenchoides besseyi]